MTPAHLLVALLDQEDGLAPRILQKLGADVRGSPSAARSLLAEMPSVSGDAAPEVRPSQGFVRALQRAEKEAGALDDEYISVQHLLLALADKSSGVADILPDRDSLMKAIAEVAGPHRVTSENPEETMEALEKFGQRPDRRRARRASSTR